MTGPTERQRRAAAKTAEAYRLVVELMANLTAEMAAADAAARTIGVAASSLDILAEKHFPAWIPGRRGAAGMGRRQWSALRLPDPDAENGFVVPFGGTL